MRRVLVIGNSGSGKSTFARALGDRTGLPVTHIDQLFWLPGWVLVSIFDNGQEELNTKSADLLIPLLGGIIWGTVGLLVLRFVKGSHRESQ